MPSLVETLWLGAQLLATIWAFRIWRLKLVRRYPILFTYLALVPIQFVGYLLYTSGYSAGGSVWYQKAYDLFWVIITPCYWALWFGVTFEVYGHMLEKYAGVRKLGKIVLYGGLGAVALVVAVLIYSDPYKIPDLNRWKSLWLKQEQGVSLAIAVLVFVLLLFKRTFKLTVPRNVQLVFATFGLYFAGIAALMVVRTYMGPGFRPVRDLTGMILYAVCLAVGGALFSQAGEAEEAKPAGIDARPVMAARAAEQLQSFNDRLVRVLNV
jgi:hypothetical protein